MVPNTEETMSDYEEIGFLGCPECGETGELVSVWKCVDCGVYVCDACCAPSYLCTSCDDDMHDHEEIENW